MKKILYIFALMAITFVSCNTNEMPNEISIKQNLSTNTDLIIHIIKKQENPYSVTNMRKALMKLQQEGLMRTDVNIQATHLYVRFLPKDSADFETLMNDTSLELFSYPLDCELTAGEKYIDSTLIGNQFTWLYTKVPVDFVSPVSNYEILEDLYLPTETTGSQQARQAMKSINTDNWKLLERKSLELTGNALQTTTQPSGMQKARWWPQVTINVYDDLMGKFIPVEGVTVLARWWFNWESGITNSQGIAKISGSFGGKVNYHIKWDADYWSIRDGAFEQAYSNNPSQSGDWVANIDGGKSKAYAHVHRACWTMFYGDNLGASDQSKNDRFILENRQKISVYDNQGTGINYGANWFVFSQISIHMKRDDGTLRTSEDVYATTVHELAHSFHVMDMDVDLASYAFVGKMIYESWASAVEWAVTSKEYSRLLGYSYNYPYDKQSNWGLLKTDYSKTYSGDKAYSPVFIDLIDNTNQRNVYSWRSSSYEYPDDNVTGFTLSELSGILRKTFTLNGLKTNVKALRSDETTLSNIDKLFETYEKIK